MATLLAIVAAADRRAMVPLIISSADGGARCVAVKDPLQRLVGEYGWVRIVHQRAGRSIRASITFWPNVNGLYIAGTLPPTQNWREVSCEI